MWRWLISAAMAMADYDGHSQTMATSGVTALPLGGVVLVDLDDQSVLRELSRPLERRGLPVQRSRPGPSRARCERMDQQKPILLYLGEPRAAVVTGEDRFHCRRQHQPEGQGRGGGS